MALPVHSPWWLLASCPSTAVSGFDSGTASRWARPRLTEQWLLTYLPVCLPWGTGFKCRLWGPQTFLVSTGGQASVQATCPGICVLAGQQALGQLSLESLVTVGNSGWNRRRTRVSASGSFSDCVPS